MESASEVKQLQPDAASPANERSTVEFPYSDQDAAFEVAKGVHMAGGTACDTDQLAAQMQMEAKGGGFRMRLLGAKVFDLITYERAGRVMLTDLGRRIIDPAQERAARVDSFLAVELYRKVHDQFKGGPLPPQAGLDRALVTLGVGSGVKEKARQVLLRSAKQAGFLDYAADRLVKPGISNEEHRTRELPTHDVAGGGGHSPGTSAGAGRSSGGGDGGGRDHPLIQGLLMTLPAPGSEWSIQERVNWLTMANSIFTMIYKGEGPSIQITQTPRQGGATSAG